MNVFKYIVVGFAIATLGIWLWGLSLPNTQKVRVERVIHAPIEQVWSVATAWEAQPVWRKDLRNVEVVNSTRFIEYSLHSPKLTFDITRLEAPSHLELKMSGIVSGYYILQLTAEGHLTQAISTEEITLTSPWQRVWFQLFFDLEQFAKAYLNDLNDAVSKE